MNYTLIKLLHVYLIGDTDPGTIKKWEKHKAMLPEVDDFTAYLREQYHNENPYYKYLECKENAAKRSRSIMYFNLALACVVFCEELEKDYLKIRAERVKVNPDYIIRTEDTMNGRETSFRDYDFILRDAIKSLYKIIEMEPDLPEDITSRLLEVITDLRRNKWWMGEINPWGACIHFQLGNEHEQEGNIEAIKEYRESLRVCPDYRQTLICLGELYQRCMNYDEAADQYEALIRYYPDSSLGYHYLSELYSKQGRLDEAAELYQKFSELEYEDEVDKHMNNGTICFGRRQFNKAIQEINESLKLKPDKALAYAALAIVYAEAGDTRYDNAASVFKKVVEQNYGDNQAYLELSLALQQRKDRQELLKHLWACRKLLDYSKKHFIMANLVQTYIETLELKAKVDKHINEGITCFRLRQFNAAILEIRESLKLKPDEALAYAALAIVYAETGDNGYDNAASVFKKAVEQNYGDNQAYLELSLALQQKENHGEFLKHLYACRKLLDFSKEHSTMSNLIQTYIETLEQK